MSGDCEEAGAPHDKGPLLGKMVAGSPVYDPTLLFPVPRANARQSLPGGVFDGFGEDVWHAYELSWLDSSGMPRMFVGVLTVPATSANIVESKSLKLYLNSLNGHRFADAKAARACIEADLSRAAGAAVSLQLLAVDDRQFMAEPLTSRCLDDLQVAVPMRPDATSLKPRVGDLNCHTHLLRSLCPVTAQPDWATLRIAMRGQCVDERSLLAYLLAYRNHQEFHEQCVERIYTDLWRRLVPAFLSVQALYTRRGGLDICPWRCSERGPAPRGRINRQ